MSYPVSKKWLKAAIASNEAYLTALGYRGIAATNRGALATVEHPGIRAIIAEVVTSRGLCAASLLGPSRKGPLVNARRSIAKRAREQGYSYPQIGRALNRDHTTIMHAVGAA